MKLPRSFLLPALAVALLFLIAFYLGFSLVSQRSTTDLQPSKGGETLVPQRQIGSGNYNSEKYVVAIENNAEGSIYSSRAQMRGKVSSWEERGLVVVVGDEVFRINLPEKVYFKCVPSTYTSPDGKEVPASTVYLDLRNAGQGELVDSSDVKDKITQGSDLTLQVNVDKGDNMTADLFVGYGCSI